MPTVLTGVVTALAACAVCAAAAPAAARAGRRWRLLDEPDQRKRHPWAVPCTGGAAVLLGFAAGCLAAFGLAAFDAAEDRLGGTFIAATAIVFLVGLLEDTRGCPVVFRLSAQTAAAGLVVAAGYPIAAISTPLGTVEFGAAAGSVLAVVWLVGITNAINLMDGLDGLAGGVSFIIAGSLAVFAAVQGDPASIAVSAALCGACAGFLPWNWRPAKLFLGDSGALTIGFVLAWLSLTASLKASTAVAVFVPLLVLGVPAIDTLLVMGARFAESPGCLMRDRLRRVVQADRLHLHYLLSRGDQRRVVLGLYGLVSFFCLLSLLAVLDSNANLAAATLLTEIVVVALLRRRRGWARPSVPPAAGAGAPGPAPEPAAGRAPGP